MNLDDAFLQQSDIAIAIKQGLDDVMQTYGYAVDQALVTDIQPDEKVKAAMNEINAAQREQVAASARGEAEKILKVKQAEAEAESKALQGQGIANQRKAIIEGLKQSIEAFSAAVEGTTAKDVMMLVLVTQYLDTIKEIGAPGQDQYPFHVTLAIRHGGPVPPDAGRGADRAEGGGRGVEPFAGSCGPGRFDPGNSLGVYFLPGLASLPAP